MNIALESVTVHAAGHAILQDLQLRIEAGTHVAIVGASGAGKSSLVGLLLGWHRPAAGRIVIDGQPLDASGLERLRQHMVWIDPSVQLWNRTLLDNLSYGLQEVDTAPLSWALQTTELYPLLERLPDGLQTCLGEGGGLVSGGEGQRVRVARGLLRPEARLVILDEPFRGLERALRQQLLRHLRQHWRHATLLCISHDVGETLGFERVLVMQGGRIVEVGPPQGLAGASASCYRALLAADKTVRADYWGHPRWRRLRLHQGRFEEEGSGGEGP